MTTIVDELITKLTLDVRDYEQKAGKVTSATKGLNDATQGATASFADIGATLKLALAELDSSIPGLTELMGILKSVTYIAAGTVAVVGTAVAAFGVKAMMAAAEMDALEMGVRAFAASSEDAERNILRLADVAKMPALGLPEVLQASARLQAAGFDARLAERAILSFGNALASVGGGREEIEGVMMALTQIASKGMVSAEEIMQIAERVPMIRQAMKAAFGTANTEDFKKLGIGPQAFIMGIIDELEKLAPVGESAKTVFENIGDVINRVFVESGRVLNTMFTPALATAGNFLENMVNGGWFREVTSDLLMASDSAGWFKRTLDAVANSLDAVADHGNFVLSIFTGINGALVDMSGSRGLADLVRFINGGSDGGDTLIRVISVVAAVMQNMPEVIAAISEGMKAFWDQNMAAIGMIRSLIVDMLMAIAKQLNRGFDLKFGNFVMGSFAKGSGGALIQVADGLRSMDGMKLDWNPLTDPLKRQAGPLTDAAQEIYDRFKKEQGSSLDGDTTKGGFRNPDDPLTQIAENTEATAKNTEKMVDEIRNAILGGGALGAMGVTPREVAMDKGFGGGDRMRAAQSLTDSIDIRIVRVVTDLLRR